MATTRITIDEELLAVAMEALGVATGQEAVESALTRITRQYQLASLREMITDDDFYESYLAELKQPRWTDETSTHQS